MEASLKGVKSKDPWLHNQPYSTFKTDALIGQGVLLDNFVVYINNNWDKQRNI